LSRAASLLRRDLALLPMRVLVVRVCDGPFAAVRV
jgi:hypothetical protein